MAAVLKELKGSGDYKAGPSGVNGTGLAIVIGAADQDEAYSLADSFFPDMVGNIPRGSIDVKDAGTLEDGTGVFMIEVEYSSAVRSDAPAGVAGQNPDPSKPEKSEPVKREQSFSTKGGTQHIVNSRDVVYSIANGIPTDPKNRIGDSEKGTAGADIIAPQPVFSIKLKLPFIHVGYFTDILCRYTGTVNKTPWKGFQAREVLFEGADADYRDGDGWNLTYSFRYSPSEPYLPEDVAAGGIDVGLNNRLAFKAGWDYLDVRYERVEDQGRLIDRPYEAHVHQVYRESNFDDFGI
jgi:hypothetical protein